MFHAHINAEYCHSVKSIKCIYKYVTKCNDMAIFGLLDEDSADEMTQYQLGRYVNNNEATSRVLSSLIHQQ